MTGPANPMHPARPSSADPKPGGSLAAMAQRMIAHPVIHWTRHAIRRTRDLALPPLCAACRAPVEGEGLCATCWGRLNFIARPYCERMGVPFAYDPGPGILSEEAIAHPPAFARARAAVCYDDVAGAMIHAFKYHDRTDLAPLMARWMVHAGAELLAEADLLVPVPLHWQRGFARRYNQSAMLARQIARLHAQTDPTAPRSVLPVEHDLICRVRATPHQVGLNRDERARNVQGAFEVPTAARAHVAGRRIVLIDDVLTSGATIDSCARALLRARAARVDALTFARVVERPHRPI